MNWDKTKVIERVLEMERALGRRPTKRVDSNLYFLSRRYFGSWNNLMAAAGFEVKSRQQIILPTKFSESFYYFLGLVITDGHIQFRKRGGKYRVLIYTSEIEERELILNLIRELFSYQASIRDRISHFSRRKNYEICISSKALCILLNNRGIPYGSKSYSIRVPKEIVTLAKRNFFNFLRGVFDGDGSIIFGKSGQTFKISSGSKKFISDLNKKLKMEGFNSPLISQQKKNVWELKINVKNDVIRLYHDLYDSAKYFYPRKKNKWESNIFKNDF